MLISPEMVPEQSMQQILLEMPLLFICYYCHWVISNSLWLQGLQHIRLPHPSLSPRVCSNSCPLDRWCYPTILSSVTPFSSCLQSFPESGSFSTSWLFASGGQSIGASASATILPMNIQCSFPLGSTGLISLLSKGISKVLLQHHSLKASILHCSAFSNSHISFLHRFTFSQFAVHTQNPYPFYLVPSIRS